MARKGMKEKWTEMVARSTALFKARYGRSPGKGELFPSDCVPKVLEEQDWLLGMSEHEFEGTVSAWRECSHEHATVGEYMAMVKAAEDELEEGLDPASRKSGQGTA